MMRLKVYYHDLFAGWLIKDSGIYSFTYNVDYLENPQTAPVSLSLPLRKESYESKTLFPFFRNLIPEGWLFELNAKAFHIDERDEFGMLALTGKDCVGAVSVMPEENEP